MAYPTDGSIGINVAAHGADSGFTLGTRITASSGQVYLYVKAGAAINQYDCVAVTNGFTAVGITKALADLGQQVGFAQVAFTSGDYGWVAINGEALIVTVLGSCDKGVGLYTSATTGILDDGTASQTRVWGAVLVASAGTTGTTSVSANLLNPHTQLSPAP